MGRIVTESVILSFLILFILFTINIEFNRTERINIPETLFMIFGLGFSLEKKAAMQEHSIGGLSFLAFLLLD